MSLAPGKQKQASFVQNSRVTGHLGEKTLNCVGRNGIFRYLLNFFFSLISHDTSQLYRRNKYSTIDITIPFIKIKY